MITSAKRRDGCRHRRAEPGVIAAIYLMSSRELIPQARHGSKNTPVNLSVSSKPNVRSGRHMAGFVILNTTGYKLSLHCRARIEEINGWLKTVGSQRKTRYRGEELVGWMFELGLAAYNLVHMRKLIADLV